MGEKDARDGGLRGLAGRVRQELGAAGVAGTGILCGHVWIWEVPHRTTELFGPAGQGVVLYLAMSAVLLAAFVLAVGLRPSECAWSRADWPLALAMAAGTALLSLPGAPGPLAALDPGVRMMTGAVLGGAGVAWSYLEWAYFYARMGARQIVCCIFCAMALGSVVKLPLDLLPPVACCAVCCLLCADSPALAHLSSRRQLAASGQDEDGEEGRPAKWDSDWALAAPQAEPGLRPRMAEFLQVARPAFKVIIGVVAYGLVIGIMQGMRVPADPMPKALLSGVHHLLEVGAALVVVALVLGQRRSLHAAGVWRAVLLATGAGVMLLPLVGTALSGWALIAVAVAQTLVVMLLWGMLADVASRGRGFVCPPAVFGLGWTVYSLSFPAGQVVGTVLDASGGGAEAIGLIVYALALATIFFMDQRDFSANRIFADLEAAPIPVSMGSLVHGACQEVGRRAGLTDREVQVMEMICLGRSKSYIAEELVISENTVRSHARRLYAKLGAHSK